MAGEDDAPTVDARPHGKARDKAAIELANERYRIGESLGEGGMGEVLVAQDQQIGREVAIKRMRAPDPSDPQVERFLREARIQGRLQHPAVAPVHELGHDRNGRPFFVMKRLTGTTLARVLDLPDDAKFSRQQLLRAFVDVCLALEYAHVQGVIHRDLKPENIMLGDFGEVYVIDWGIAKVTGEPDPESGEEFADLSPTATVPGTAIGTPGFMAPEQASGDPVDARSDVFALGIVLSRMLARDAQPAPELEALCARATEVDPERRVASARKLAEAVQAYLDGDRDLELRRRLAREQLESAQTGMARGEDSGQVMRDAARALALDPQLPGAAELVTRLMLEPPRETPPAVQRAIEREDVALMRAGSRGGMFAQAIWSVFAIALAVAGRWILSGVLASGIALTLLTSWRTTRATRFSPLWSGTPFAFPLAVTSCLFTPLVASMPVAIILLIFSSHPIVRSRLQLAYIATVVSASVLVPLVLAGAGVLPPIAVEDHGAVRLTAAGFAGGELTFGLICFGTIACGVAITIIYGRSKRRTEMALRRAVHLQAWRLAQLAPGAAPG